MARRALVVSSQIEGLKGVDNDAASMAAALGARGFEIDLRTGVAATRAGILDGYDRLIANSTPDDVAVFYYAGHGAHASVSEEGRSWQCIVPSDYRAGNGEDWRGITAWELSIKQQELTERTRNVTTILDCCHSSQMSRGNAIVRAVPHPVHGGFGRHLEKLRRINDAAFDQVNAVSNPHAVRVVACGQTECAFEYDAGDGRYRGVFTSVLIDVLDELGERPLSWELIVEAVRTRVLLRYPRQRPAVEGPARRRPFALAEVVAPSGVAVSAEGERIWLSSGDLAGTRHGDIYGVMPAGVLAYNADRALAEVEVIDVMAMRAVATATREGIRCEHLHGATAFPIRRVALKRAVNLELPDSMRRAVVQAIEAAPLLRVGSLGAPAIATLRYNTSGLVVEDVVGQPVSFPDGIEQAVNAMVNLAVAHGLREMEGEHGVLAGELAAELCVVKEERLRPLPSHAELGLANRFYVRLENRSYRPLFIHVFSVDMCGAIGVLTEFARTGMLLECGAPAAVLGQRADGAFVGIDLSWPEALPADGPRFEEVIVIATTSRTNLTGFAAARPMALRSHGGKLQTLLAQLRDGLLRGVRTDSERDGYLVKRLSYLLRSPGVSTSAH